MTWLPAWLTDIVAVNEVHLGEEPVKPAEDLKRIHANKLRHVKLPRYFALTRGEKPAWWRDAIVDSMSGVFGVYEAVEGSAENAVVLTADEIVVLPPSQVRVRYDSLASFDQLSKEPVAERIGCRLKNGARVEIPVVGGTGAIFTILHFLVQTAGVHRRRAEAEAKGTTRFV